MQCARWGFWGLGFSVSRLMAKDFAKAWYIYGKHFFDPGRYNRNRGATRCEAITVVSIPKTSVKLQRDLGSLSFNP